MNDYRLLDDVNILCESHGMTVEKGIYIVHMVHSGYIHRVICI